MILILSNKFDVTVDFVVRELQNRDYPYLRLNTEDLPETNVTTEFQDFSIKVEKQGQSIDLVEEIGAVWNRRPGQPFEFTPEENRPDKGTVEYIREQWSAWIQSLQTIQDVTWINSPEANRRMESKIHQLRLADELDFRIPDTVVTTNESDVADAFERQDGSMVAKALSSPIVSQEDQDGFVFSTYLEEPPASQDESLGVCPTIFQEPLLPKTDYRVTVIEEQVFPVEIMFDGDVVAPVDWRTEQDSIRFEEVKLPDRVEEFCRRFVDEAGLLFGAIDLVKSEDEFVFLEINPNGEWGWLQKPWGIPIAENLTECLIKHDSKD